MPDEFIIMLQYTNLMIKKNLCWRRLNIAGARVITSSKLPFDFFLPSIKKQGKESSRWLRTSNSYENAQKVEGVSISTQKNPLMFTFNRSSSQGKSTFCEKSNIKYSLTRFIKPSNSLKTLMVRLPPVCLNFGKQNLVSPIKDTLTRLVKKKYHAVMKHSSQIKQTYYQKQH